MTATLWPDWRASLADASASDWITVAAYLLAAVIAARAAQAARHRAESRDALFWRLTAAVLVFLGINELFDLQTVLTAVGKAWALWGGWYEDRRLYQFEFILALAVVAFVGGFAALRLTRGAHRTVRWALLGLVFIGIFVLLRAASFHHVDALLGMGPDAFNWGSVQEMLGILIVGLAAHRYRSA
ncbi:MAG TPA: hypothetical protein VFS87_06940 [Qipengyuania sp.]|nr:hypothetical protein [Qipengyuania sp.]